MPTEHVLPYASPNHTQSQNALPDITVIALILALLSVGFAAFQHGGEYTPIAMTLITFAIFGSVVSVVGRNADVSSAARRSSRHYFVFAVLGLLFLALVALWPTGAAQSGYYRIASAFSTLLLVALIALLSWYRVDISHRDSRWWIDYAFAAALTLEFFALFTLWPVGPDQRETYLTLHARLMYLYLAAAGGFLTLLGFLDLAAIRKWWFPALLVVHFILGFWTIRVSPVPHIDVWYFQEVAPRTLLSGHNPYDYSQVHFDDIYDSTLPGHQRVYGEGMVEDGHLIFGFPYPPISLFCSTLGVLLGNDTRYAQALAMTLAGLLIGYSRPGRFAKLAAVLLLFTPASLFVLGRGWTEPFVVFFLALTVFCAARKLRWPLPIALGLFLASKQYLLFAIPLSFLLLEDFNPRQKASWRAWIVLLVGAIFTAALVTSPLALWNWHAFWFSTVTVQKDAPFRWDALSYLVWIGRNIDTKYTTWVWLAFAGAGIAMLLSFLKAKRGPAGFAAAMALTYIIFIAFNKQAFCNYYYFVIGCTSCALALCNDQHKQLLD